MQNGKHPFVVIANVKGSGNHWYCTWRCGCFEKQGTNHSSISAWNARMNSYQAWRRHCIQMGVWLYEREMGYA